MCVYSNARDVDWPDRGHRRRNRRHRGAESVRSKWRRHFFGGGHRARRGCKHYRVVPIGPADGVIEKFFALTVERKMRHPAVVEINRQAKLTLFGTD